ncbi:MAG: L-aspartate oxidase [Phycisphaerae bacterium]|nr:L-aspartate oxidase [Phycisphaerae bacterium]
MTTLFDTRRYLSNFDTARAGHVFTEVLVIGSGVAGARAALEAARQVDVILITKRVLDDTTTSWAQGGIAAVMADDDSFTQHRDDTLKVGGGLNDPAAVELAVRHGPDEIRQLLEWGIAFDKSTEGKFALTREGGHKSDRVLHARGDSTGRVLVETLDQQLRKQPRIRIFENCFVIDLLTTDDGCVGAVTYHEQFGHQLVWSKAVILAGGGCGRLYRETTNPELATGDALAMAYRAGARLRDMEMIQFHPTTLYIAGSSRALISEAVRGEGGKLVDRSGQRFMPAFHPDAELAPRDVVSQAIATTLAQTHATNVYLDVRHIPRKRFAGRFPYITKCCAEFGIDVGKDLIPVRPAAHYLIGGIVTDLEARTSVPRLYSCGECAGTGLHGANRLASNSLLEGLVFGRIAGEQAAHQAAAQPDPVGPADLRCITPPSLKTPLDLADISNSLQSLMWRNVGIERHGDRLQETIEIIEFWGRFVLDKVFDMPTGWEVQNMLTVGRLIVAGAYRRRESCGGHFRCDTAKTDTPPPPYHVDIHQANNRLHIETIPVGK